MVSHHSDSDGISPSLTLMSPSNFHKMHTFLRVTNTCHCLVMMTYTNIQRIALLFHYFFHTKLIPKPPGLLLCSLHHHYIRHPASAAPLTRKLPTMRLVPRRPPEKETLVWRLLAFVPPFSGMYIHTYTCMCTRYAGMLAHAVPREGNCSYVWRCAYLIYCRATYSTPGKSRQNRAEMVCNNCLAV